MRVWQPGTGTIGPGDTGGTVEDELSLPVLPAAGKQIRAASAVDSRCLSLNLPSKPAQDHHHLTLAAVRATLSCGDPSEWVAHT